MEGFESKPRLQNIFPERLPQTKERKMDSQASGPSPSLITTALIVVSVLFPIISASSIALRILAHRWSKQPLHSDGYWIIISWFFTFGLSILVWVHAGKSGVDYYNVDTMTGTELSLEVRSQTCFHSITSFICSILLEVCHLNISLVDLPFISLCSVSPRGS